MYVLAASAAGVSALALVQPVESKIIYTPAHVKIGFGGVQEYKLDLNHDGIYDFRISTFQSVSTAALGARGNNYNGNSVRIVNQGQQRHAAALFPGEHIGARGTFAFGADMVSEFTINGTSTRISGPWANVRNRYLGFKFKYGGRTHYGWARLNVTAGRHREITALLTGYAYETIPNRPIVTGQTTDGLSNEGAHFGAIRFPTPQPATLGILALGSPGLSIWRKEQRESCNETNSSILSNPPTV